MNAHKINTTFNKSNELILQEIFSKKNQQTNFIQTDRSQHAIFLTQKNTSTITEHTRPFSK